MKQNKPVNNAVNMPEAANFILVSAIWAGRGEKFARRALRNALFETPECADMAKTMLGDIYQSLEDNRVSIYSVSEDDTLEDISKALSVIEEDYLALSEYSPPSERAKSVPTLVF